MRLPKDPENWTLDHAIRAVEVAWKKFKYYEDHVDFSKPQEDQDKYYLPYWHARETALEVVSYVTDGRSERTSLILP